MNDTPLKSQSSPYHPIMGDYYPVCDDSIVTCADCGLPQEREHLDSHMRHCSHRSVQCFTCDQSMLFFQLEEHIHICPKRLIDCSKCRTMMPHDVYLASHQPCPNTPNNIELEELTLQLQTEEGVIGPIYNAVNDSSETIYCLVPHLASGEHENSKRNHFKCMFNGKYYRLIIDCFLGSHGASTIKCHLSTHDDKNDKSIIPVTMHLLSNTDGHLLATMESSDIFKSPSQKHIIHVDARHSLPGDQYPRYEHAVLHESHTACQPDYFQYDGTHVLLKIQKLEAHELEQDSSHCS